MTNMTETSLKKALFDAYDGFADKRYKNLERHDAFAVDDRKRSDHGADGKLFHSFWPIFVDVVDAETVRVTIRGELPETARLTAWYAEHEAEQTNFGREIIIMRGQQDDLQMLAAAFKAVIAKAYPVASWKFSCARTAKSLSKLRSVLSDAWKG